MNDPAFTFSGVRPSSRGTARVVKFSANSKPSFYGSRWPSTEHFTTRPKDCTGEFPGNVFNSFRHERKDERAKKFKEAYRATMAELAANKDAGNC